MADTLLNSRRFARADRRGRLESPQSIDRTGFYAPATKVVAALERLAKRTGYPQMITVDNGEEVTSKARGVKLDFIRPGKPAENAVIESFNGRFETSA